MLPLCWRCWGRLRADNAIHLISDRATGIVVRSLLAQISGICYIARLINTGVFRCDFPTSGKQYSSWVSPGGRCVAPGVTGEIAISPRAYSFGDGGGKPAVALTEPLASDILRALALSPDQVLQLTPDRVAMLPQDSRCNSWRLGTDAPLPLAGAQLSTPAFDELLATSAPARMALWQQICAHEHDFYPQHG